MTKNELENKLHTQIPLTKLMKLSIEDITMKHLFTKAPLDININDKGTAFGGSLNTIAIISSWSVVYLLSLQLEIKDSNIVIIKNETSFLSPVTKNITCKVDFPSIEEINKVKDKIDTKNSSSIQIRAKIIEDEKVCLDFTGLFVISKI